MKSTRLQHSKSKFTLMMTLMLSLLLIVAAQSNLYAQAQAAYVDLDAVQLDQLVAPIALDPDSLVAQILTASTYPDQVAAADTWLNQNMNLPPDQRAAGANAMNWDPAVKGLIEFPSTLDNLAKNTAWNVAARQRLLQPARRRDERRSGYAFAGAAVERVGDNYATARGGRSRLDRDCAGESRRGFRSLLQSLDRLGHAVCRLPGLCRAAASARYRVGSGAGFRSRNRGRRLCRVRLGLRRVGTGMGWRDRAVRRQHLHLEQRDRQQSRILWRT